MINKILKVFDRNALDQELLDACRAGDIAQVKMLLGQGANVSATGVYQQTPLHIAAGNGHLAIVQTLINARAKVNAQSSLKQTPLHFAAYRGHVDVVQELILAGAAVNAKGRDQFSALHLAALRKGRNDIVKLLLTCGAKADAIIFNSERMSHTFITVWYNYVKQTRQLLQQNGLDLAPVEDVIEHAFHDMIAANITVESKISIVDDFQTKVLPLANALRQVSKQTADQSNVIAFSEADRRVQARKKLKRLAQKHAFELPFIAKRRKSSLHAPIIMPPPMMDQTAQQ